MLANVRKKRRKETGKRGNGDGKKRGRLGEGARGRGELTTSAP